MDQIELSVELNVKSVIYILNLNSNETNLQIELQNTETAEFWKGAYDKKYIEDLTRKTGNFKSFPIFVSMLQTALNQESSTVTIDLLTFNDLENLRNKSSCLNSSTSSSVSRQSQTSHHNSNKKYLIMTYNVEFDRINYPLQMRYQGKLDSVTLLDMIRNLRNELKSNSHSSSVSHPNNNNNNKNGDFNNELKNELKRLKSENQLIKKENETLEMENQRLTNLDQNASKLNSTSSQQMIDTKTLKELNCLKKMIKNIEEDAIKEKTLYQKQLIKKTEEINKLKAQMNKMIENERIMCNKLKAIKDLEQSRASRINSRASSKESIQRIPIPNTGHKSRQYRQNTNSQERYSIKPAVAASSTSNRRFQSNSLDRFSRTSSKSQQRKVSISPASSTRSKRFDPTEYIRQKKSKELNVQQQQRNRSRSNANNNLSSDDCCSKASLNSNNNNNSKNQRPRSKQQSIKRSSGIEEQQQQHQDLNSSVVLNYQRNNNIYNRDEEMREIDQKLKSLHNLIKYSL